METTESYLNRLIGKFMTKTEISTSTIIGIKGDDKAQPSDQRMSISIQLFLEDYLLDIYNPITLQPSEKELNNFIGLKVIDVSETKEEAELIFDNGYKIIVNMRDEVYYDPEAMCLTGPDNFWVVWN